MKEEAKRLSQSVAHSIDWKKWGPYLSERAWGTVREDYSADGSAWEYFSHDHARSRAYRWNEDGLLGICDRNQYLCFALAVWNYKDPILKERLFGLTGSEGNHGEDVKEYYYFLDSTPTHSYMKALYRYPHAAYPYADLVHTNRSRSRYEPEYELLDTGIFAENRFTDLFVEYAKADSEDILIKISAVNRGPEEVQLALLPTIWFRNAWSWGEHIERPRLSVAQNSAASEYSVIAANHAEIGEMYLVCEKNDQGPELLFTENETNYAKIFGEGAQNTVPYVKDGIHEALLQNQRKTVNPDHFGTKAAAYYSLSIPAGATVVTKLRLTRNLGDLQLLGDEFENIFSTRIAEADEFYADAASEKVSEESRKVQRSAFAGMLWSKQFYSYGVERWLEGDPGYPAPPQSRLHGRNHEWTHLNNQDIFSMPDNWEYPWYAAWDLAFHCITLSLIDPSFAKRQLLLLCREWSMHPNGQLPAYEWAFGDVNPPVHAWAALRVFKIERRMSGKGDTDFLEKIFHKLLINFTWWVNRKDPDGHNVFQGGFLGMDNIGVFDRSAPLPSGETLEQSDSTAWMGFFCLSMFAIAAELSAVNPVYEDLATKFFEHFLYIASALNTKLGNGIGLWDDIDGFYYDVLQMPDNTAIPLKVRSMVGLIPLLSVEAVEHETVLRMPNFMSRVEWFLKHRPDLSSLIPCVQKQGQEERRLLALVSEEKLQKLLQKMLDPQEFLGEHGIRSVSKFHHANPYVLYTNGMTHSIDYEPAESTTALFGGNSNWRGPIWFPINYLLIEALQRFDYYYGASFQVECPTGSGNMCNLWEVSQEISRRLIGIFLKDSSGNKPVLGDSEVLQNNPLWNEYVLFHEYFHGETGKGLGASHQTGWTGLVAKLIQQSGE